MMLQKHAETHVTLLVWDSSTYTLFTGQLLLEKLWTKMVTNIMKKWTCQCTKFGHKWKPLLIGDGWRVLAYQISMFKCYGIWTPMLESNQWWIKLSFILITHKRSCYNTWNSKILSPWLTCHLASTIWETMQTIYSKTICWYRFPRSTIRPHCRFCSRGVCKTVICHSKISQN